MTNSFWRPDTSKSMGLPGRICFLGAQMANKQRERLSALRVAAHAAFDRIWKNSSNPKYFRRLAYRWLANQMGMPMKHCHFGRLKGSKLARATWLSSKVDLEDILWWISMKNRKTLKKL